MKMGDYKAKEPRFEEAFYAEITVAPPVVVGQDTAHGRRQLIEITGGRFSGKISGVALPGGVDSQIIRPNGLTELEARYGVKLDDGESIFIFNKGIRRVAPECAAAAARGEIVDPDKVYFTTVPTFEVYSDKYRWLEQAIFICRATRLPDKVLLKFYEVV